MMRMVLFAAVMVFAAGCSTSRSGSPKVFNSDGIPTECYRVGGGYQIRFVAPEDGVVYWVNQQNGMLLGTESLSSGQAFEFFHSPEGIEEFKRIRIDISEGDFALYFVPASKLYKR